MQSKASKDINMRNSYFLLCVLLLMGGVSGDKVEVSVMEGDSVILKPDAAEEQRKGDLLWKFQNSIIVKINTTGHVVYTSEGTGIFRDRLKLDYQTGSLNITNIRTTDSGDYEFKIKNTKEIIKEFSVAVRDKVKSLSVVEGDTVTLHTGVIKKQGDELIQWKFGDQDLNGPDDIDLNGETGDLTIRNIRSLLSGDNELVINTTSMILHRKLHINIRGKMKTVSGKEGDHVILDTGLIEREGYDLIFWKFEDQNITEIKKRADGRLFIDHHTGSLINVKSRITDSGDYQLHMISSSHTIQRTISVTVSGTDRSAAVSGISGASVVLMVWAVTVFLLQV